MVGTVSSRMDAAAGAQATMHREVGKVGRTEVVGRIGRHGR